ncbi:ISNCY family transposase [Paenibacillus periandrae]|uniref:ISNCY family transposase n=1 Tax=Paenibacillus periandrae TaxID=1761741 RepID=UPI001F08C0A3|nr:ISNCY family transposase [Paenibacillus periandrae]
MTDAEMKKVLVIEKVIASQFTIREAAERLGLSNRQVIRLKKTYQQEGAKGFIHKNRGRKPVHTTQDHVKEQVIQLYRGRYRGRYRDSNNCHFAELLEEKEALVLSPSSVRRILLSAGLKQNKARRRQRIHQPRERRSQAGALWQTDASSHAWLEDRGPRLTLHAAIDDATGQVVGAVFRPTETREGYFTVMRQAIETYGVPLGLYSDRHNIFRSPNEKLTLEQELAGEHQPLSQFGKAMSELHISHIKAMTPQAKGRIERLWGTLQDRLVIQLRLRNVCTLEQANALLPELMAKHNHQFAVLPKEEDSAYRQLKNGTDLTYVFTLREHRQIGHGQTLSYNGKLYTLDAKQTVSFKNKSLVEVRETLQGEVVLFHQGHPIPLRITQKPDRPTTVETKKAGSASPRKPAAGHLGKQRRASRITKFILTENKFSSKMP